VRLTPTARRRAPADQEVTVLSARRIHRPTIVSVVACALLASALSGAAAAQPPTTGGDLRGVGARDVARPSAPAFAPALDLNNPDRRAVEIALAQERYYSSYGDPEPLTVPQSPASSADTPWLPIAFAIAATLAITAASATRLRRLRTRRRRAARAAA
jgi:hypothetical protein